MILKKFVTLVLLLSVSFQILHAFAFVEIEKNVCTVEEYTQELSEPTNYGDVCDIHFEYHHSYILTDNINIIDLIILKRPIERTKEIFINSKISSPFRPPINS